MNNSGECDTKLADYSLAMKRLFLIPALLLILASGFATGGTCPSRANHLNASTNALVTLASLGVTSCCYCAATGSNSNDCLSEATGHPCQSLPGMHGASITPTPGTVYYVSNSGSDSNNGTSTSTPWKTIAHVDAHTFNPGDSVLF